MRSPRHETRIRRMPRTGERHAGYVGEKLVMSGKPVLGKEREKGPSGNPEGPFG